jgi:hypothetical protein
LNKNWIYFLAVILLCGTLIVCTSMYVSNERNSSLPLVNDAGNSISQSPVLNIQEAAEYLRISVDSLQTTIKKDEEIRASRGQSDAYDIIPYIDLNGSLIFYRPILDKWIEFNSLNK